MIDIRFVVRSRTVDEGLAHATVAYQRTGFGGEQSELSQKSIYGDYRKRL